VNNCLLINHCLKLQTSISVIKKVNVCQGKCCLLFFGTDEPEKSRKRPGFYEDISFLFTFSKVQFQAMGIMMKC